MTPRVLDQVRNVVAIAVLLGSVSICAAQATLSATGNPTNAAQFAVENGSIDLGNGDLHLNIPIAGIPQRGNLSLDANFVYDSAIWEVTNGLGGLQWTPTSPAGGWSYQYNLDYGSTASVVSHACPGNSTIIYVYSAIQWTDVQGTLRTFPIQTTKTNGCTGAGYTDTPTASGYAIDASGYYATLANYTSLKIWDPHGTLVASTQIPSAGISNDIVSDRNGNEIQFGLNGTVQTDSLGHVPIAETIAGTDGSGLPSLIYLDVPVAQAHTARYTIRYEAVSVTTAFAVPASKFLAGQTGNVGEFSGLLRVLQSITLPDGTSYTFTYDNYGLLKGVLLPKGGNVAYAYSNDSGAGTLTPPRWASSYTGSTGTTSFSYVNNGAYSPTSETGGYSCSKITDTAKGATLTQLYVFSSCGGSIRPMKALFSPTSNNSVVDEFFLYSYDFSHPCAANACTGAQWVALTGVTKVLPSTGTTASILAGTGGTGLISDTQYVYGTPGSGSVTATKQWDYRTGTYPTSLPDSPPGLPKRETDTVYGYTVNNALFPTTVTTKDSTGALVSEVDTKYDEPTYFVASPAGVPSHNNALAATNRGNVTTITQVPHGGVGTAPSLVQHLTHDDTGSVVSMQDPKLNVTTFAYDSTDTFPAKVTSPVTPGLNGHTVSHVISTSWDVNAGVHLSDTDQNGQVTSNTYDSIGRLSNVTFSNAGTPVTLKTYTYPSPTELDVSTLQVKTATQTASIPSSTIVDGFGRVTELVRSGVSSVTTYDAQGRVYSVTNPHTSAAQTTDGTSYTTYDELGRLNMATLPNGHSTKSVYTLNTVTSTDPLSHQRQWTYDAFGQLSGVLEPDTSNALTWQTTYTRSDWGLLSEIDQKGGSTVATNWRTRTFAYDGLQRLVKHTTQEAGLYQYTYDNDGNIVSVISPNSSNNTVSYTYDALNRMVTETIAGGPTYTKTYDAQDASGDLFGIGLLTSSSDGGSVQARYTHDPMGHLASQADCRPSNCGFIYKTTASYDFQGNLLSLTYPDGRQLVWAYDLLNRPTDELNTLFGNTEIDIPLTINATYFPTGQLQDVTDGNGVELTSIVDPSGNLTSLTYNNGVPIVARTYTWDVNARNLIGINDSSTGRKQTFTYDQLDRIKTAVDTGTTTTGTDPALPNVPASSMNYSVDAWGNLTQAGTYSFNPAAGPNNHVGCTGCTYDLAGHQLSDGLLGDNYSYRADGHQQSSNGVTYSYDALEQRATKSGTAAKEYFYFRGREIATRLTSSGAWNDIIYGANGILAEVAGTATSNPVYRISDHLNTLAQTTDGSGNVQGSFTALPFGQSLSNSTSDSILFTEHEYDPESYTSNTQYRQYSPTEGRWLAPDPYSGSYNLSDPQTFNRYAYALNSPMVSMDPLGLDSVCRTGTITSQILTPGVYGGSGGISQTDCPIDGGGTGSTTISWGGVTLYGGGTSLTLDLGRESASPDFGELEQFKYEGPSAPSKRGFGTCVKDGADAISLANFLHQVPGLGSGVGGFVADVVGGNTFSGAADLVNSFGSGEGGEHSVFYNMATSVAGGPTQGFSSLLPKALQDSPWGRDLVGGILESLPVVGEYASGIGEAKLGYDALSYFAAGFDCAVGIIH